MPEMIADGDEILFVNGEDGGGVRCHEGSLGTSGIKKNAPMSGRLVFLSRMNGLVHVHLINTNAPSLRECEYYDWYY